MENTCQTDAEQPLTKKDTRQTDRSGAALDKEHPPNGSAGTIRKEEIQLAICRRYFSYAWGTFAEALWQST